MKTMRNEQNFIDWLIETSKIEIDERVYRTYLEELNNQYMNTGVTEYEMSKWETKSGMPECIKYEVEQNEDDLIFIF